MMLRLPLLPCVQDAADGLLLAQQCAAPLAGNARRQRWHGSC
ncbi:hypothetical protein [Janthinobacterium sp. J1-1]|nr:hypothetical protein [Janthinobacterium sp. J1-1]